MAEIKLLGARFSKLSGERKPEFSGQLEISTNVKLVNIDKFKDSKDSLKIDYELVVDYKELGNISIEGTLFVSADSKTIKEIQKSWKDKKFDTEEQVAITNLIIRKSSIKAFALEDELGLPLHIQLPLLSLKK
ncbi:MAG: hypothetical protein KKF50_04395 [Nanoarchaeota archaeon]|nr:hypothetical protein [Nanoarchaeota archaeon]